MKASEALNATVWIIQVGTLLLFVLAGYTIYSVLSTVSTDSAQIQIQADISTGYATISFRSTPTNSGPLNTKLTMALYFESPTGLKIANTSESVELGPGVRQVLSLSLKVRMKDLEGFNNADGSFLGLIMEIKTLEYLGLSNDVKITGGRQ